MPQQSPPNREELEAIWWERVQTCRQLYEASKLTALRAMEECSCEGPNPESEQALHEAHRAESEALEEYMRVLRVFHELVVERKRPD